jgi:signal transduction histidine kinase
MFLWSGIYLGIKMYEIHDGVDEGLLKLRSEFMKRANREPGYVEQMQALMPFNINIQEIEREEAVRITENFQTTRLFFSTEGEKEDVRMLTSAFYCHFSGKNYRIEFFVSMVDSIDLIISTLILLLALLLVLIITLILVSRVVISRANKPFHQLLNELKHFRLDNSKEIVLPQTNIVEYAQLNDAVNDLISKSVSIFSEQKEFIENCSHELQTPLAVVGAKLELLMQKYESEPTYIQEITEISNILNRMKRLNSSLLFLSKIRNKQFVGTQPINLNIKLESVINELSDFIEYKEILVDFDNKNTIERRMNVDLAHILFANLLKNAIVHNEQGGKIHILCAKNQITISNSGTSEIKNIFSRYNQSQTNVHSSGLGLSIVKSIADLYEIKIKYHFEENRHIFLMIF